MNHHQFRQAFAFADEPNINNLTGGQENSRAGNETGRSLADLRLGEIARSVNTEDELSQILSRSTHHLLSRELASLTVATIKRFLLSNSAIAWFQKYRYGLSSEAIAAIVKTMTDEELAVIADRFFSPVTTYQSDNETVAGSARHLSSRLQANSPQDDEQEILFSILEGLSYGCGDALICLKPANGSEDNIERINHLLSRIIKRLKLPTRFSVMTKPANRRNPLTDPNLNAVFIELSGNSDSLQKANGFDVNELFELAVDSSGLFLQSGMNSYGNADDSELLDQTIMEAREFGLARAICQQAASQQTAIPWIIVNSVAGLNEREAFFNKQQLIRACLEKTAMARLHGLTIGLDICSSFRSGIAPTEFQQLTARITELACPDFLTATAGNADPLLEHLTTSFREHPRLRKALNRQITSAMQHRLAELGAINSQGEPAAHALTTARLYARFAQAGGDNRSSESLLAEGLKKLEQLKQRGFDLGYGHIGNYLSPKKVEMRLETIYIQARQGNLAASQTSSNKLSRPE